MASSRAVNHLLRRTPVLSGIPILSNSCYSGATNSLTQARWYSNQKSVSKVDKSDSGNQVQTGFAEVGKFSSNFTQNSMNFIFT